MEAEMVVARFPQGSPDEARISAALSAAGIAHDIRHYTVDVPASPQHGAAYTMIVVASGRNSRAMEAFDIANAN